MLHVADSSSQPADILRPSDLRFLISDILATNVLSSTSSPDFFSRVHAVVAEIPFGKVTTYGHIAEHLGVRSAARTVGWALNGAGASGLPCHRVVNRFGALTGKRHFEGPDVMEERLRSEGVTFDEDGCVDLDKHLWIPRRDRG